MAALLTIVFGFLTWVAGLSAWVFTIGCVVLTVLKLEGIGHVDTSYGAMGAGLVWLWLGSGVLSALTFICSLFISLD